MIERERGCVTRVYLGLAVPPDRERSYLSSCMERVAYWSASGEAKQASLIESNMSTKMSGLRFVREQIAS